MPHSKPPYSSEFRLKAVERASDQRPVAGLDFFDRQRS